MISIHYLFQFFVFICIIPEYTIAIDQLHLAFGNGYNIIRCSGEHVQVYFTDDNSEVDLGDILECDNANTIHDHQYTSFMWDKLQIICSSNTNEIHEDIFIRKKPGGNNINEIPDILSHTCPLGTNPYTCDIDYDVDNNVDKISTEKHLFTNAYFNKKDGSNKRITYISFKNHPIICRIIYTISIDDPCPSMDGKIIDNVTYVCYYNLYAGRAVTIDDLEAELKQVEEEKTKPDGKNAFVLELEEPTVIPVDFCNSKPNIPNKTNQQQHQNQVKPLPKHQKQVKPAIHKQGDNSNAKPKQKTKSSISKIIGIICGLLLLIGVIGAIAFFIFQKRRSNNSSLSSSSSSIENGNDKGLSSHLAKQSQQSIATTTDANRELSINVPSMKEKPNIELQKGNKKQRIGTSMVFNEDA